MKKTIRLTLAVISSLFVLISCDLFSSESDNNETVITKPSLKKELLPKKTDSIGTTKLLDTIHVDSLISE